MTAAASLTEAAISAADNLLTLYTGNTLKAKTAAFCATALAIFPDQTQSSRPVADWLTLLSALSDQMPVASVPYSSLNSAIDYVYRLCFLATALNTQTPQQVTNAQATALLAAYNAQ